MPQQAMMAHALAVAVGDKITNLGDPKFVQQWSSFIYSVLNMAP
jgi:hypothetical protein